jgi:hypothetical protein
VLQQHFVKLAVRSRPPLANQRDGLSFTRCEFYRGWYRQELFLDTSDFGIMIWPTLAV